METRGWTFTDKSRRNREELRRIYRRLHPRQFPYSSWERQRQLDDLWPAEQERFARDVRIILAALSEERI